MLYGSLRFWGLTKREKWGIVLMISRAMSDIKKTAWPDKGETEHVWNSLTKEKCQPPGKSWPPCCIAAIMRLRKSI
jgi:hypothetical protein